MWRITGAPVVCPVSMSLDLHHHRGVAQQRPVFTGYAANMEDHATDDVAVKLGWCVLAGVGQQFPLPLADDARVLDGQRQLSC